MHSAESLEFARVVPFILVFGGGFGVTDPRGGRIDGRNVLWAPLQHLLPRLSILLSGGRYFVAPYSDDPLPQLRVSKRIPRGSTGLRR